MCSVRPLCHLVAAPKNIACLASLEKVPQNSHWDLNSPPSTRNFWQKSFTPQMLASKKEARAKGQACPSPALDRPQQSHFSLLPQFPPL